MKVTFEMDFDEACRVMDAIRLDKDRIQTRRALQDATGETCADIWVLAAKAAARVRELEGQLSTAGEWKAQCLDACNELEEALGRKGAGDWLNTMIDKIIQDRDALRTIADNLEAKLLAAEADSRLLKELVKKQERQLNEAGELVEKLMQEEAE
jgi:hypothetical protein